MFGQCWGNSIRISNIRDSKKKKAACTSMNALLGVFDPQEVFCAPWELCPASRQWIQWITYWNINGSRLIHKEIDVCILLLNKKDFLYQTRSQIHNSGKQIELSGKWTRPNLGSLWSQADPASEGWFSFFIQIHFPSLHFHFHPLSWYLFTGVFPFPSLYFSKLMQFSKFMKRLLQSHLKQFRMLSSRPTAPYLPLHQ